MSMTKRVVDWPLIGGLDTKTSPISVQPGSFLQCDNTIQERINEWRRRNGFTQSALDTSASFADAFHVGSIGHAGFIGFDGVTGPGAYRPSLSSGRWAALGNSDYASNITRIPVTETSSSIFGFGVSGNMAVMVHVGATRPRLSVLDMVGGTVSVTDIAASFTRARCAATATHLCAFLTTGTGNIVSYVIDVATGAVTGPTTLKTNVSNTFPYVDAIYYGGSTVTVVYAETGNTVHHLEFNPSTGALATDVSLGGGAVSCAAFLGLLADPTGSGIRFVATSHTTPTTRVVRVNSAGAIQTNDQVEAVISLQVVGIGSNAGADWNVAYKVNTGGFRANYKSGAVGAPVDVRGGNTADLRVDSMGWGESGSGIWQCIVGLHSTSVDDPQDTWIIATFPTGSTNYGVFSKHADVVPGQAAYPSSVVDVPYQAVRTGTRTFAFALPVLNQYNNEAGTIARKYSLDIFTQTLITESSIAQVNLGKPVPLDGNVLIPGNGVSYFDDGALRSIGTSAPPRTPTLVQSAGGSLTVLSQYQYCVVVEKRDASGNVWRSPPSVPAAITLTGANATVTVTAQNWYSDEIGVIYTVALYRTAANGSVFRRIASATQTFASDSVFIDTAADTAITDGAILYTTGELQTAITPPASHLALFNDRLWAVNRDFRTELWCTKNLRPGRQPEFINEGVVDIDDAYGDITGISSIADKGVVFKRNAIYFITGDGLTDAGSGEAHRYVQVSQDIGAIPGSPVVAAGDVVYFVSDRGIYLIDRSGDVKFVGAAVDQFINAPLVQTPETIYDGVFHPKKNWVVFVTTNYILVHDRTLNYWTRFTGLSGMKRCLVVNNSLVLFRASDGTVWREGDTTQTTDQGVVYTGTVRSAWIRPNGFDGQLRLWRAMCSMTRTSGGANITPALSVYLDNSETPVQSFSPPAVIAGATSLIQMEARPQTQNCATFSVAVTLPSGDCTFRIEKMGAEIGVRGGKGQKRTDGERWT